jgi:hypothetical protein
MKHLLSLAAVASVLALMCLSMASAASATMLEVGGVGKNESIAIKASLKSGSSLLIRDTAGGWIGTCSSSPIEGNTTNFTGTAVEGPISTLSWGTTTTPCIGGTSTVHAKGTLSIDWIKGTTNGTVLSKNGDWTMPSALGQLRCQTPAEGLDLGTLTGVTSGNATLDLQAVLPCGSITTLWTGTYTITSPEGLGVIDKSTTLEVGGTAKNESIAIKASLKAGTSSLLSDTSGFFANTCTTSTVEGKTEGSFTGASVVGGVSALSFSSCNRGNPTIHGPGSLSVEWLKGTTNGTVKSSNAIVTVPSALGLLTCTTPAAGTDLGTLTGAASGTATVDISTVLACGITTKWTATYTVTSPEGLGVTS